MAFDAFQNVRCWRIKAGEAHLARGGLDNSALGKVEQVAFSSVHYIVVHGRLQELAKVNH